MYGDIVQYIFNKKNLSKYWTWYMNSGMFTPNLNWFGDCIIEAAKKEGNVPVMHVLHSWCWLYRYCTTILFLSQKDERAKTKMEAVGLTSPTKTLVSTNCYQLFHHGQDRHNVCVESFLEGFFPWQFINCSEILDSPIETFNKIKHVPPKHHWLLVVSAHLKKYACQIGNLPNFRGENKKIFETTS